MKYKKLDLNGLLWRLMNGPLGLIHAYLQASKVCKTYSNVPRVQNCLYLIGITVCKATCMIQLRERTNCQWAS